MFGVGSELAGGDGQDKHFSGPGFHRLKLTRATTAPSTPSTKGKRLAQHAFIGRVAQGQRGAACVCWACLKIGRESVLGVFE